MPLLCLRLLCTVVDRLPSSVRSWSVHSMGPHVLLVSRWIDHGMAPQFPCMGLPSTWMWLFGFGARLPGFVWGFFVLLRFAVLSWAFMVFRIAFWPVCYPVLVPAVSTHASIQYFSSLFLSRRACHVCCGTSPLGALVMRCVHCVCGLIVWTTYYNLAVQLQSAGPACSFIQVSHLQFQCALRTHAQYSVHAFTHIHSKRKQLRGLPCALVYACPSQWLGAIFISPSKIDTHRATMYVLGPHTIYCCTYFYT